MRSVLLFILSFHVAHAADWEYVTATGTSNVYVDVESVSSREGAVKAAWFLFDHLDTRYDVDAARVYKSSRQLIEINCQNLTLNWVRMETFAGPLGSGAKVGARNINNQGAAFLEHVQDSARAAMARILCD